MDQRGGCPGHRRGGAGDRTLGPFRYLGALGLGRFPAPRVDRRFEDGAEVALGPIRLTAHVTGGHTPGCTSWSFPVSHAERDLLAVDVCSLTLLPFMSLVERETYPGIRRDFEHNLQVLRALPVDLFLASHGSWFGLDRKHRERATADDPADPFIDRAGYSDYLDRAEAAIRDALAEQQGRR